MLCMRSYQHQNRKGGNRYWKDLFYKELDSKTFRNYYFLKEELVNFCRENGMPTSGSKIEIADRIAYFLDTGKIKAASAKRKKAAAMFDIYEDTKIEDNQGKSLEDVIKCWK